MPKGCNGSTETAIIMAAGQKAYKPNTLAHELGHALGLSLHKHVADEKNLMYISVELGWAPVGTALTEEQRTTIYLSQYAR
jgi:hypothetical protein